MSNPSTRRDPLLIPLVVALVVAVAGIALFVMRNADYQQQQNALTTLTQEKAALETNVADLNAALETAKAENAALTEQKAALETNVSDLTAALDAAKADNAALTEQKAALEANVTDLNAALETAKANDPVGSYQMTKFVSDGEELDGISCSFEVYEDGTALMFLANGMLFQECPFLWSMDGDELVLTNVSDTFDEEFVVQRVQGFTRFRMADAENSSRNYLVFERIQTANPVGSYQMTKYVNDGEEQSLEEVSATLTIREDGTATLSAREGEEEVEESITWRLCGHLLILTGESIGTIAAQIEPDGMQIRISEGDGHMLLFAPIQ